MSGDPVGAVADAVLHEGSQLYPYRASAPRNRQRWSFGVLVPPAYRRYDPSERDTARTECLLEGSGSTRLEVTLRFLQEGRDGAVETRSAWVEPTALDDLAGATSLLLGFPPLLGSLDVSAAEAGRGRYRVSVEVRNLTPFLGNSRDEAIPQSLLSVQVLLRAQGGRFESATDPPEELRELAARCCNEGLWPVLVGPPGSADAMLASAIVLPDHPQVAPESPAEWGDATDDAMLALRVRTFAEQEKREARADSRGAARAPLRVGDRVRIRAETAHAGSAARRTDLLDLALAGRTAIVQEVAEDLEGGTHVAVVLEDDPGRDLGVAGWPGHRFFFHPAELERA